MRVLTYNMHTTVLYNLCRALPDCEFLDFRPTWAVSQRPQPLNWHALSGSPPPCDAVLAMSLETTHQLAGFLGRKVLLVPLMPGTGQCAPASLKNPALRQLEEQGWNLVFLGRDQAACWGYPDGTVIRHGLDVDEWPVSTYELASAVAIVNSYPSRQDVQYELYRSLAAVVPIALVGAGNEGIPGACECRSLEEYAASIARFRACLNTVKVITNAMVEAMAAAIAPVTVASGTDAGEYIVNGVNGFASDDPEALRNALSRLVGDREYARRVGAAARETVRARFNRTAFRELWLKVFTA